MIISKCNLQQSRKYSTSRCDRNEYKDKDTKIFMYEEDKKQCKSKIEWR